ARGWSRESAAGRPRRSPPVLHRVAETDGNRTRRRQLLPSNGFEDRADHQTGYASLLTPHACMISPPGGNSNPVTATESGYRLTQYAHGGGCACKIPPGDL